MGDKKTSAWTPLEKVVLIMAVVSTVAGGTIWLLEGSSSSDYTGRSTHMWTENVTVKIGEPIDFSIRLDGMADIDSVYIDGILSTTIALVVENREETTVLIVPDHLPGFSINIPRENFEQLSLFSDDRELSLHWSGQLTIHREDMEHPEWFENEDMALLMISAQPQKYDEDGTPTVYSRKEGYLVLDLRGDE